MWGLAENAAFPVADRLACALKALSFYGRHVSEDWSWEEVAEVFAAKARGGGWNGQDPADAAAGGALTAIADISLILDGSLTP